jgi:YhcH/YjgK/YiaL family protein
MIFGHIDEPSTFLPLSSHPMWSEAFAALAALDRDSPLGVTELRGEKMFVNVHTYETKPAEQCRFEGHRDMIDVQFMIDGGECIEWVLKEQLEADGDYLPERDFQYFHRPARPSLSRVHLLPRHFGIFFPEDGHCPKIHDGIHPSVFKAVVKIHRSLIAPAE